MSNTEAISKEKFTGGEGIAWRRLPLAVLLATVAAAVANTIIYFTVSSLGFIPRSVVISTAGGESPMTVSMVLSSSVIGAIGAAVVFAIIGLFARRPVRLFRIVAVVVLVLSFAAPLTISGAPLGMVLSMEVMHVVAWAVITGLLTTIPQMETGA